MTECDAMYFIGVAVGIVGGIALAWAWWRLWT